MIPVTNTDQLKNPSDRQPRETGSGIRFHSTKAKTDMAINNNQRYRMNLSKVKSGYIDDEN